MPDCVSNMRPSLTRNGRDAGHGAGTRPAPAQGHSAQEDQTPVHLWHGAGDTNAPTPAPPAAEQTDAILHVSESSGHNVGHDRSDEFTSVIVPCAG
jgi:hypothetical protein